MPAHSRHYPKLGPALWALALEWPRLMPATRAARLAAVANLPHPKAVRTRTQAAEYVEAAAADISRERASARAPKRPAYWPRQAAEAAGLISPRPVHYPPSGTLIGRLEDTRIRAVMQALKACIRLDQDPSVGLADDPAQVGAVEHREEDRNYCAKSYRCGGGFRPSKIEVTLFVTVPTDWRIRVLKQGLATLGGLLTLDASALEGAPEGWRLYAATWVQQKRGYSVAVVSGIIAVAGDEHYHAQTAPQAIRGLKRKLHLASPGATAAKAARTARLENLLDGHKIPDLAARYPEWTVRVADARRTGACEYGIRGWIAASGLPTDAEEAPLAEVYSAYLARPVREARAAILQALKRQRAVK